MIEQGRKKWGYPDLTDGKEVGYALLMFGLFPERTPPCFSGRQFADYIFSHTREYSASSHYYIEYKASRNVRLSRLFGIPHPEAHWELCSFIGSQWDKINATIGKHDVGFSYCHIRKFLKDEVIYRLSYGTDYKKEEDELNYSLGCRYVVKTDISNFYPSIYSHAIPWAIMGKEWSKDNRGTNFTENKKKKRKTYRSEPNLDLWPNDLDRLVRACKDDETNGILIGPHTSSVLSEILLTVIDSSLKDNGFSKVVRYIDDYKFFADSEEQAIQFLKKLESELKKFELMLSPKKTEILKFEDYYVKSNDWVDKLQRHSFSTDYEPLGFTSVYHFLESVRELAEEIGNSSVLSYAFKKMSNLCLSDRAIRLYAEYVFQLALFDPYLLNFLDEVILDSENELRIEEKQFRRFLMMLKRRALETKETDTLGFLFYYSIQHDIELNFTTDEIEAMVEIEDCIPLVLAFRYASTSFYELELFNKLEQKAKFYNSQAYPRDYDKYWLFIYEALPYENISDPFLSDLKKHEIQWMHFRNERQRVF